MDWTGPAGGCRKVQAQAQAQADVHVSAKNLVPPCIHPSTLHPAPRSLGKLSCSSHSTARTTPY